MIEKEPEAQKKQVPFPARGRVGTGCTEDHGFPRGTVMVFARVFEQNEWDVNGLICISP